MTTNVTPETALSVLIGQMAWQVRADEHGCIMMEFGAPHLDIREPLKVSDRASAAVQRLRARRVVTVVGDWHLWIESCNWRLHTGHRSTSSKNATSDTWQSFMDDIAGQHLTSVASLGRGDLRLVFDGGIVLDVSPDPSGSLSSWSLLPWQGPAVTCSAAGHVAVEPH